MSIRSRQRDDYVELKLAPAPAMDFEHSTRHFGEGIVQYAPIVRLGIGRRIRIEILPTYPDREARDRRIILEVAEGIVVLRNEAEHVQAARPAHVSSRGVIKSSAH